MNDQKTQSRARNRGRPANLDSGELERRLLEAAERRADEAESGWQRARADYQNLKRRSAAEVEGAVRRSLEGLFAGLLLVLFLVVHLGGIALAVTAPVRFEAYAARLHQAVWLSAGMLGVTFKFP